MMLRRCQTLFLELDSEPRFGFETLLHGGDGLDRQPRWRAWTAHLPEPVTLTLAQAQVLADPDLQAGSERDAARARHGADVIDHLLALGLLLSDDDNDSAACARDRDAREVAWWPPALIAQSQGGWDGIDIQARNEAGLMLTSEDTVAAFGAAPPPEHRRRGDVPVLALPPPRRNAFDDLLAQRRTCRNFDAAAAVSAADLATLLHRVWGAIGTRELAPGAVVVKKNSPAGGGLHAVEAYVLVQRAEGLAPGVYHYLALEHALEPLQAWRADEARANAHRFVAGQHWFADAPVLVVMTARFDRLFWKYRRHSKAWRVAHLDVGHLSQTMYLSVADLGLGAFVTAAINDREIERALDLAPLREGALAIVGFGPRAATTTHLELDGLVPTAAARS